MPVEQVIAKVLQPGYSLISKLEADDGRWEVEGIKNGKRTNFHAAPKSDVIIARSWPTNLRCCSSLSLSF